MRWWSYLLEQILFDPKMTVKEKKKKLRKFKELHPNIYSLRFPTQDSEPDYMQVGSLAQFLPSFFLHLHY